MAPPDWTESLREHLLPRLHAAGIAIDTRARLGLEVWLHTAAERGWLTDDPNCAKGSLRAILSRSERDQKLYDLAFEAWLAAPISSDVFATKRSDESRPTPVAVEPAWHARVLALTGWLIPLIILTVMATAIGTRTQNPSAALVQTKGRTVQHVPSAGKPQQLNASPMTGPREVKLFASPWLFGISPTYYASAVAAGALCMFFSARVRRQQIARVATRQHLREQEVFARHLVPIAGTRRLALRRAARLLRRPRTVEGREFDVTASVQATSARCGVFAATYRPRVARPRYLVLIDRASAGDQQAHWAAELVRDLASEGVTLGLYEYDRDPRRVAPVRLQRGAHPTTGQRYRPLAELASQHQGQALVLISDGHDLIDLASGAVQGALQVALKPWPRRVLITPRPIDSWGQAEDILAGEEQTSTASSFLVLPLQAQAFRAADYWLTHDKSPEMAAVPGAPRRLPPSLTNEAGRWLEVEAPPEETKRTLLEELQSCLGPTAYSWLAASAAYPYLSGDLTAFFAARLSHTTSGTEQAPHGQRRDDAGLLEARLVAIAQLPWCRQGYMPDWLRHELFLSLPASQRQRVRAILHELFDAAARGEIGGAALSLGVLASGKLEERRGPMNFLRRLGQRLGLSAIIDTEPPASPLRDVIYLGVLRGDYDDDLAPDATAALIEAASSAASARITRNPLRWLAAGGIVLAYPVIWLKWRLTASRVVPEATSPPVPRDQTAPSPPQSEVPRSADEQMDFRPQILLSASGVPETLVRQIETRLEPYLRVVRAETVIRSEDSFMSDIFEVIRGSRAVALVIGPGPHPSQDMVVKAVSGMGRGILPILVGGAELPASIRHFSAFRLTDSTSEGELDLLFRALRDFAEKSSRGSDVP